MPPATATSLSSSTSHLSSKDCAQRGMRSPVLAVGDGALGFWGALRDVFPASREQRCWFRKVANVLGALPKNAHPGARKALAEIWNAEDRRHALDAVRSFETTYAKFPKAVAKDHRRHRRTARVLRLSGRAPAARADYEPYRVHLRDRPAPHEGHPRTRLASGRAGDGFQVDRGRPSPLARRQRPHLVALAAPERPSRPASSSNDPTSTLNPEARLKDLHPQVLPPAPRHAVHPLTS